MILIISGLPGTGKTTLCQKIAAEFGYNYISDWDIFSKNNVVIDPFLDKNQVSQQYSQILIDYINKNQDKNLVLDTEYSISPTDYTNSNISAATKIIYLGFISLSHSTLMSLFQKSVSNSEVSFADLKKRIEFYQLASSDYQSQCLTHSLDFIDIDHDRNQIINSIISHLKDKL